MSDIVEYLKNCINNSDEVLRIDGSKTINGKDLSCHLDKVVYPEDILSYVDYWVKKHGEDIGYIYGIDEGVLTIDMKDGVKFMGRELGLGHLVCEEIYWKELLWPDVTMQQVLSYVEAHSDEIMKDCKEWEKLIKDYAKCYKYYKESRNILSSIYGINSVSIKRDFIEHDGYYIDIEGEDINFWEFLKCTQDKIDDKYWLLCQLVENYDKWGEWKCVRDFLLAEKDIHLSCRKNFEFIDGIGIRLIGNDWNEDDQCKKIVELGRVSRRYGIIVGVKTAKDFIELVKNGPTMVDGTGYCEPCVDEYCIYMHECEENGKRYIGQTCMIPEVRWDGGGGYRYNKEFFRDIMKYGWNNFKHLILCTGLTKEEADKVESFLIKFFDTTNPDKGYNKAINEKVISPQDFVLAPKERKKIALTDKKIQLLRDGRLINPVKGSIRTIMKKWYESEVDKDKTIDAGERYFDLPKGIIWYMKIGDYYQIDSPFCHDRIYDSKEPLDEEQIIKLIKNNKDMWDLIEEYKDLIEEFGACQSFYLDHEEELAPFGIKEISICFYINSEGSQPWIHFELSNISKKYFTKFLGISTEYWDTRKLEVLKMLAEKGSYEKFLAWGDENNWTF